MTKHRHEAERVCADWVARVEAPCEATPVQVAGEWYMVTSGTGEAPHFAYPLDEVAAWVSTRDGKPLFRYEDDDTTEYQDFCESASAVEDETVARYLLDEGFRICAPGSCAPIIAEARECCAQEPIVCLDYACCGVVLDDGSQIHDFACPMSRVRS